MKKSIAGVMAGAMAVSAMATTVSAFEGADRDKEAGIVLSYDLNLKGSVATASSYSVTFTYADNTVTGYPVIGLGTNDTVTATIGGYFKKGSYDLTGIKISGTSMDLKSKDTWGIYDAEQVAPAWTSAVNNAIGGTAVFDSNGNTDGYKVEFTKTTDTEDKVSLAGFPIYTTTTKTWSFTVVTVTKGSPAVAEEKEWVVEDLGTDAGLAHDKYMAIAAKVDATATAVDSIVAIKDFTAGDGTTTGADGTTTLATGHYYAQYQRIKTAAAPEVPDKANSDTKTFTDYEEYTKALALANYNAANSNGLISVTDNGVTETADEGTAKYGFRNYSVTLDYQIYSGNTWTDENEIANNLYYLNDQRRVIDVIDATAKGFGKFTGGEWVNFTLPLRSSATKPGNVISRLTDCQYTYPQAVLNDIIANNENVQFTFTSCQSLVDTREYVPVKTTKYDAENNMNHYLVATPAGTSYTWVDSKDFGWGVKVGDVTYIKNPFYGVAYPDGKLNGNNAPYQEFYSYFYNPYFTQDLYQKWTWQYLDGTNHNTNGTNLGYGEWGPNGTEGELSNFGSYAASWNKNLLAAGLVVNSAWTMQLNQTTALTWGDKTVTFFWDDIKDDNVSNAKNFITSLQLYTPVEWFWDKLDINVGAAISEDVTAGAGLEDDGEDVPDEDTDVIDDGDEDLDLDDTDWDDTDDADLDDTDDADFDDDDADFDDDDADFDDTDDVDADDDAVVDEDVEDVEEKVPPKTGNAPIALAVIPVALAAAAVVAKKRS